MSGRNYINLEDTLILMKEAAKEARKIEDMLEPVEGIDRTSQLETSYSQNPVMLRDMDSNHDTGIQSPMSYH